MTEKLKSVGARYGDSTDHARIVQGVKQVMSQTPGWQCLSPDEKKALEMIQHKLARILTAIRNSTIFDTTSLATPSWRMTG